MRASRSIPATLFALVTCALASAADAQRGAMTDTTTRAVDRVFDAWRSTDSPGCALGVSRNGRVVYERGYGMANLETGTPISPSSIFHVASVSKQFTAMAIMLLAREGKLSVDDNIRKYLPEIPDYGTPITIRHLLTHTSGLRDQWELLSLARGRFEEDRITEADVMDIVPRQTALNFTPGADVYLAGSLAPAATEVTPQGVTLSSERLQRRAGVYVQPRTMQIVELLVRDGRLMLGRQGTVTLTPVSEDRMRISGQPGEAVFTDAAASAFDLTPVGGRPLRFERRPSVVVTPQLLASYAGDYVSDELAGAVYRVTSTDSTIALRTGTSTPVTARLVFADTFLGGGYTIQFTRSRGQVTGFEVTNGRIRHVKFVRRKP